MNLRNCLKELHRFLNRHQQYVRDGLAFVLNFQCLTVVSFALANFARNVDVWQEVHLDLQNTVPFTGFTSTSFDIEAKPPLLITTNFGVRSFREQVPNHVKRARVCRWIRPRSPSDR